jgi:hypothetical protein
MQALLPGDVIVYHGIVGGERGLSLVVGVWFSQLNNEESRWRHWRQILVIENQVLRQRAVDLNGEGKFWTRISERRCT